MNTDDARPKWEHETPEVLARWLVNNPVTSIEHRREFIGEDKMEVWIELVSVREGRKDERRRVSPGFFCGNYKIQFLPDHKGLVTVDKSIVSSIYAINKWEAKNHRERLLYERLRRKYESS